MDEELESEQTHIDPWDELFLLNPGELHDKEWLEVRKLAIRIFEAGEKDQMKAHVKAYFKYWHDIIVENELQ